MMLRTYCSMFIPPINASLNTVLVLQTQKKASTLMERCFFCVQKVGLAHS